MKHWAQRIGWILAGALGALVALEVLFRLLPVSMGLQRANDASRWPLVYAQPHTPYAYSISWKMLNAHRGQTNNYGQIAPFDYVAGSRPVVVLGDSFIESLMNDPADSLQSQLARRLGEPRGVYGLGVSGLSGAGYVALGAMAREEFRPRAAVVVIVDGDLSESLQRSRGSHYLIPAGEGFEMAFEPPGPEAWTTRVRKSVGDSALFRYLQANLQFSPGKIFEVLRPVIAASSPATKPEAVIRRQELVADWMLSELPRRLGLEPQCIALLLDADRYAIYRPEQASEPKDSPRARAYLVSQAKARGFAVSDLGDVFRVEYARQRLKFDHWPVDRHWNRVGHGVAAEEAYRLLTAGDAAGASPCLDPSARRAEGP